MRPPSHSGKLVYPDSSYGYDVDIRCSPPCNFACQNFNVRGCISLCRTVSHQQPPGVDTQV